MESFYIVEQLRFFSLQELGGIKTMYKNRTVTEASADFAASSSTDTAAVLICWSARAPARFDAFSRREMSSL